MNSNLPETDRDIQILALCYQILSAVLCLASLSTIASPFLVPSSWIPPSAAFFLHPVIVLTPGFLKPWSLLLVGAIEALLLFEVGSCLRQDESRTFVLVMAWIITGFFPLGTVLGVATLWKLFRKEG